MQQKTDLHKKKKSAEIFQVLEVTGHPPGLVTHIVWVVLFQLLEGRWWLVRKRAARGVELECAR